MTMSATTGLLPRLAMPVRYLKHLKLRRVACRHVLLITRCAASFTRRVSFAHRCRLTPPVPWIGPCLVKLLREVPSARGWVGGNQLANEDDIVVGDLTVTVAQRCSHAAANQSSSARNASGDWTYRPRSLPEPTEGARDSCTSDSATAGSSWPNSRATKSNVGSRATGPLSDLVPVIPLNSYPHGLFASGLSLPHRLRSSGRPKGADGAGRRIENPLRQKNLWASFGSGSLPST